MLQMVFSSCKKMMFLLCGCIVFICSPAQAESSTVVVSAINSLRASIDSLVALAATYIFQTPFNIGDEVTTNYAQNSAQQTIAPNVLALNNQDIQNGLAPNTKNLNFNLTQMTSIQAADTILSTITVGGVPVPFFSSSMQQSKENALALGNQNFNFQSLIAPPNLVYATPDLQSYALNYIRAVSGYATPISNINLSNESGLSTKQKLTIQSSGDYQLYMAQRRQLVAQQSAGLSSLYAVYQRRLPVSTIKAGDTPLGTDSPSLAQIEQHNATWRTTSPAWYTQMATASQANVEREILFVLAEIQLELYKIRLSNERMMALTAVNQLNSTQTSKQALDMLGQQVQTTISHTIQGATEKATETTQQPSTLRESQEQAKAGQEQKSQK